MGVEAAGEGAGGGGGEVGLGFLEPLHRVLWEAVVFGDQTSVVEDFELVVGAAVVVVVADGRGYDAVRTDKDAVFVQGFRIQEGVGGSGGTGEKHTAIHLVKHGQDTVRGGVKAGLQMAELGLHLSRRDAGGGERERDYDCKYSAHISSQI